MTHAPDMRSVSFRLIRGRGAASGQREFAALGGAIAAQSPLFLALGLDLTGYFPGTLNLDLAPKRFEVRSPRLTLRDIKWRVDGKAEDFSFCAAAIELGETHTHALVYYPRTQAPKAPETVLQVLAPYISGASEGDTGVVWYDPAEIWVGD